MKQLRVSPDLALPIGIANKTICIFGKGGSGKSNLEVVLAEELYAAGIPTCIVDPADIHYGIKSSRDGKSAGLPYIVFGGLHADVPIYPENGSLLADLFLDRGLYLVIVTQPWTGGERARFMTDFANQLYKRGPEKEQRGSARVLILEEAHEYVPLSPGKGEEVMLGAMKRLYTVGRNYWIGFIAATRRPAKMHTDLRNGADATAFFQIVGTQDRKAMTDYLGEVADKATYDEILSHLAKLPVGTAYFYQPHEQTPLLRLQFRYRKTLDTTTTEITAGHKVIKPVLAEVDLTKLGDAMASAREKAKADDPKLLRERIRQLEVQIRADDQRFKMQLVDERRDAEAKLVRLQKEVLKKEAEVVEVPTYPDNVREYFRDTAAQLIKNAVSLNDMAEMLRKGAEIKVEKHPAQLKGRVAQSSTSVAMTPTLRPTPSTRPVTPRPVPPAVHNGHASQTSSSIGQVTGPQQRILDSLAWYESVGITQANRNQLALLANYTPGTGTFNNYLGALRTAEFIDYPTAGYVSLTAAGRAAANPVDITPTSEAMHQVLYSKLGGPRARILAALIAAYPNALSREALADLTDYTVNTGTFNNYLGSLRSLQLVDYPHKGAVIALPVLFLEEAARR